jgi:hypothetical protein
MSAEMCKCPNGLFFVEQWQQSIMECWMRRVKSYEINDGDLPDCARRLEWLVTESENGVLPTGMQRSVSHLARRRRVRGDVLVDAAVHGR